MTKVQWSWYKPEDKAERDALHDQLEKRVGRTLDRPDLREGPVIAAVVGRVNGEIRHILFVEAEAEVQAGSPNVLTPKELAEPIAMLTDALQHWHIRIVRAFVPNVMLETKLGRRMSAMQRMLYRIGFTEEDGPVTQFWKWIPQVKKTKAA